MLKGQKMGEVLKFQRPVAPQIADPWEAFAWTSATWWHPDLPAALCHARAEGFTPDQMIMTLFSRSGSPATRVPIVVFEKEPGFSRMFDPRGVV